MTWRIVDGDARDRLADLPPASVHTCVTSPPYFGLRNYGTQGQIGLEPTPDEFVAALVDVFREVRRVLRDDGTVWINLGDSYAQYDGQGNLDEPREPGQHGAFRVSPNLATVAANRGPGRHSLPPGLKRKDLVGIPWMVAFALRADGWYLRSDIIWSKPNPMPESVTDRPTKAHEYLFLLSKGPRYFYDADAIREDAQPESAARYAAGYNQFGTGQFNGSPTDNRAPKTIAPEALAHLTGRNKRSVWTVATQPFAGSHFATMPPKLVEPCVLAGCPERCCAGCGAPWERVVERVTVRDKGAANLTRSNLDAALRAGAQPLSSSNSHDGTNSPTVTTLGFAPSCSCDKDTVAGTVLDPFAGAGTTGIVALRHNRSFVGIELNPAYADMARWRIRDDAPLLNHFAEVAA